MTTGAGVAGGRGSQGRGCGCILCSWSAWLCSASGFHASHPHTTMFCHPPPENSKPLGTKDTSDPQSGPAPGSPGLSGRSCLTGEVCCPLRTAPRPRCHSLGTAVAPALVGTQPGPCTMPCVLLPPRKTRWERKDASTNLHCCPGGPARGPHLLGGSAAPHSVSSS